MPCSAQSLLSPSRLAHTWHQLLQVVSQLEAWRSVEWANLRKVRRFHGNCEHPEGMGTCNGFRERSRHGRTFNMASKARVHGRTDMDRSASGTGIVPGQFPAPPSEVTPLAMRLLPAPLSRKASAFKASGPLLPMFPGANTGPEKQKKHQVQIPTRKTGTNTNGRASPMVGVCSRGNPAKYLGINFNWGPSYGHLLHGDSCPRAAT